MKCTRDGCTSDAVYTPVILLQGKALDQVYAGRWGIGAFVCEAHRIPFIELGLEKCITQVCDQLEAAADYVHLDRTRTLWRMVKLTDHLPSVKEMQS